MNPFIALLIVLVAIVAIVFVPFAAIWSVNELFGLDIQYTFRTWLASAFLLSLTVTVPNK